MFNIPVVPDKNFKIVRLDKSLKRKVISLLIRSYDSESTYQYLLASHRTGYKQRLRATIREIVHIHFSKNEPVYGILDTRNDQVCGVALIVENKNRIDLSNNITWRLKMFLTAGFRSTRRYLEYQKNIRNLIPSDQYRIISLLAVEPAFQKLGLGTQLLNSIHDLCDSDSDCSGIYLDSGNPSYEKFYNSVGYQMFSKFSLESLDEAVYLRIAQS